MKLSQIFDVFSRREKQPAPIIRTVPTTLRNRVFLWCARTFSNRESYWGGEDYTHEFWAEIHEALRMRHGRLQLTPEVYSKSPLEDAANFLLNCKDEEFLDFIEYIFRVKCLFRIQTDTNILVRELNEIFLSESASYELTEMIKEEVVQPVTEYPFFGREGRMIQTVAYPQVIRKDNLATHTMITKPVLQLLSDPKYKTAHKEYLDALEDYKNGDYGDCLTKCCSSFESVMKIVCDTKGWPYKPTDTASTLIKTVIDKTGLDTFFTEPLIIIATLRNKLSKSHGAGVHPKTVSENVARYALNSTASAILLIVNEAK